MADQQTTQQQKDAADAQKRNTDAATARAAAENDSHMPAKTVSDAQHGATASDAKATEKPLAAGELKHDDKAAEAPKSPEQEQPSLLERVARDGVAYYNGGWKGVVAQEGATLLFDKLREHADPKDMAGIDALERLTKDGLAFGTGGWKELLAQEAFNMAFDTNHDRSGGMAGKGMGDVAAAFGLLTEKGGDMMKMLQSEGGPTAAFAPMFAALGGGLLGEKVEGAALGADKVGGAQASGHDAIQAAIEDHMLRSGMAPDVHRAGDIAAAVVTALDQGNGHDGASLQLHKDGPTVATLQPANEKDAPGAIGMDVLASVAEKGVPHESLAAIREAVGPGHEHMSDLQVMNHVGVRTLEHVEKNGISQGQVEAASEQGGHGSKLDAVRAVADAAHGETSGVQREQQLAAQEKSAARTQAAEATMTMG
ncbi:hypothetical protein F6X40_11490 [Paraburkholderia sp. UCT31]|uniref:hypothetical protein n=1 Tax=Paraburkholderia sp. UCT31 TaxID=2615209 RepID=UPI001654D412|nr:hypothetical protein [Paraburkholderia sp. UCT31]MBC8737428.1 hypothetical protein [Paraburkholderia sp. UCT31]